MTPPRMRLILDNDYSGDPDGLFQLAHHVLSPSVDIRAIIGSHLRPGDPFDPSETTADNAVMRAREVLQALGLDARFAVVAGSNVALTDARTPHDSAGARAIVAEAMRDDTDLPLYIACGAGLTELASAFLLEPRIAGRLTVVWIGGNEHPALAVEPPRADAVEYNLNIDIAAAQVVFNESELDVWQVPRDAYRQTLMSNAELELRVRPCGAVGELLYQSIHSVVDMAASHDVMLGETYIYGDSPLVLLTALQSSFQADPSSSTYATVPAPRIEADGSTTFSGVGRPIRVYTRLDVRLMFDDLFAKLALHTA
ncbi:nucleoside hydrolase [Subtercola sp. RTI3]|uniref:nucleoside hydrolase n=1 Tax=Subtercola sp. RTI3 TaxID=3048639 RepID=UPI002B23DD8A|nr:nucleoside hydrolase [Subtercola sp. RTI3]MEA9984041.1 nucleoside hydrolase [Subtercola sp. RTI3]